MAQIVIVVAIAAVPILLMLPYLDRPLDGDEGIYAVIGRSLLHGGVPYQDLFDNKPPLLYGWFAAGFLLFGETTEATRLIGALAMSATTILVFIGGSQTNQDHKNRNKSRHYADLRTEPGNEGSAAPAVASNTIGPLDRPSPKKRGAQRRRSPRTPLGRLIELHKKAPACAGAFRSGPPKSV